MSPAAPPAPSSAEPVPVEDDPYLAEPEQAPAAESGEEGRTSSDGLTVVIEEAGAGANRRRTLVEAAAAERARRQQSREQIAVITDKNLHEFANGQLTEVDVVEEPEPAETESAAPAPGSSAPSETESEASAAPLTQPASAAVDPSVEASTDAESYWRGRVLRARMNWKYTEDEIAHLIEKIAELRQRFYAEEDPYYRDTQIKPSWDRALDRLAEAKEAAEGFRETVDEILQEGRLAGALPGWLREGVDLEPESRSRVRDGSQPPPSEYKPGEPKIAPDPDGAGALR